MNENKKKALEEAIFKIEKDFGKGPGALSVTE